MGRVSKAQRVSQKKKASKPPSKPPISKFLKPKVTKKKTKRPPKVIKTIKKPTRPTVTRPTPRPKRPQTVFRPQPRDDFQRSLTPPPSIIPSAFAQPPTTAPQRLGVSARELLGVSPERIPPPRIPTPPPRIPTPRPRDDISTATSVQALFAPTPTPRVTRARVRGFQRPTTSIQAVFAPVPTVSRPPTTRTPLTSQERQAQARAVPIEVQREANQRAIEATGITFGEFQARELSPARSFLESFGGGARQEFENIGAIAGFGTAREEVGSLAIGLPFEVLGETFTRPSAEVEGGLFGGGGFGGLGFEFTGEADIEAGFTKSGMIQETIGRKFAEDPARALGSIATIGAIEAGLFITTGGVGNLARRGLIGTARFVSKSKGRTAAEKFAKQTTDSKRGVPHLVEDIGDGRFAILQGTEEIGKRGVRVTSPAEAIGIKITRAGKLIESKVPIITGITKTGKKGKLKGKRVRIATVSKEANVPLIIFDTKKRLVRDAVTGVVKKEDPQTFLFNKNIPERSLFLEKPSLLTVRGAVQEQVIFSRRQIAETGFQAARGREFGIIARNPTKKGIQSTIDAEKAGQIDIAGRGISVLTKDAKRAPNLFSQFAELQKPISRGRPTPLTTAEIRAGARPPAELTGLPFRSVEVFSARTIGGTTLSRFLSPTPTVRVGARGAKVPKAPRAPTPPKDDFARIFEGAEARPTRAGQPRPVQARATPPRATVTEEVLEEFFTPAQRIRPVRVPVGARITTAGVIPTQIGRQFARDDLSLFQDVALGEQVRLREGQRLTQPLGQIFDPFAGQRLRQPLQPRERPIQTPLFGQEVGLGEVPVTGQIIIPQLGTGVPITPPLRPPPTTPPTLGLFGGAPPPVFPFGEQRRRRKIKKGRRSRLGRRIFDVADEPFGAITVGLGFFAEQETGRETIEELVRGDESFEPLTRQERQARARLGRGGGRRRRQNFAEGFDLGDFFG